MFKMYSPQLSSRSLWTLYLYCKYSVFICKFVNRKHFVCISVFYIGKYFWSGSNIWIRLYLIVAARNSDELSDMDQTWATSVRNEPLQKKKWSNKNPNIWIAIRSSYLWIELPVYTFTVSRRKSYNRAILFRLLND